MEFLEVGKHCQMPFWNQKDFLPFLWDGCQKYYCLEHRTQTAHECAQGPGNGMSLVICPICGLGIKVRGDEDPNAAFALHESSGKWVRKEVTKWKTCKKKLTLANSLKCDICGEKICITHRHLHTWGRTVPIQPSRPAASAAAPLQPGRVQQAPPQTMRQAQSRLLEEKFQKDVNLTRNRNNRGPRPQTAAQASTNDPVDNAIEAIKTLYPKTRNDNGKKAFQTIRTYLNNIISNPDALKFRVINRKNPVFWKNVEKVQGALAIVKAVGFVLESHDDRYRLREVNVGLLTQTVRKLNQALESY